jgi:hypothetical protein
MSIDPNETLIVGNWIMVDGHMVADSELLRIHSLVAGELERVSVSQSGWEILYKDLRDGRYWEKYFPHSEMHGGGPESLRVVDLNSVREKYGISNNPATQP